MPHSDADHHFQDVDVGGEEAGLVSHPDDRLPLRGEAPRGGSEGGSEGRLRGGLPLLRGGQIDRPSGPAH